MDFNQLIPELTVFDIEETKKFYQQLGFVIEYERVEEKFIFISYEGSQFMFEQFRQDGWNVGELKYPLGQGINFSIASDDVEQLYHHIKEQNIPLYRDMMVSTYRVDHTDIEQKEFLIQDPNGYLLRFTN